MHRLVARCLALAALAVPGAAAQEAPSGITAWCAGGVTGGGAGQRIAEDGRVTRIERRLATGAVTETPLGRDEAAFQRWRAALDAAGFAMLRQQQAGNMTCSLVQEGGGGRHAASWPGMQPPPALPAAVRQVFEALRAWPAPP